MNISQVIKQLDTIKTSQSDYEFENFILDSIPKSSRQLVTLMLELERLHAEKCDLEATLVSPDITEGAKILLHRKLQNNAHSMRILSDWYDGIPAKERKQILENYNAEEPEYWAEYLGRQAALELLALGRTTKETLDKMSMLPVSEFEESVRICVRYSNLIKDTTDSVENQMKISTAGLPRKV
jgi:hypothetical protein